MNTTTTTRQITKPVVFIAAGDTFEWNGRTVTCERVSREPIRNARIVHLTDGTELYFRRENCATVKVTQQVPVTKDFDIWNVTTRQIVGHVNFPAHPDNCFFGTFAVWNAQDGFTSKQVRSGNHLLVTFNWDPLFPGDAGYEANTINAEAP